MKKRRVFDELMEGIAAMKKHRSGKIKLRIAKVTVLAPPKAKKK
jgi:hypothetical protein